MPARIRLPDHIKHARTVYRIRNGRRIAYRRQKREATRVGSRQVRATKQRRPVDVHMLDRARSRWTLIAQVAWSTKRRCPVLQEL